MEQSLSEMITAQINKAVEKLDAAKSLLESGFIDDAISRAYYCMFHAASAVLLTEGVSVESHSAPKTMFGLRLVKSGKIAAKYGKWLNKLKDERENSDYDVFTSFEEEDAIDAVNEAEEFLVEMKRFLHENFGIIFK
ncbi:MAG: HEPN domain-containing protein [Candidatus Tectomicrobia bacterium]|uniref:HEPN domain-containing protein n=1 Tax=Tectimicrobiota bacterium TaxID=2528274 RepID=A0A933GLH8_UNCTE|nr:HEPN domain-containing protein [Candidatus Tectomicrobia bacterium]